MFKSMTGFGRGFYESSGYNFTAEIKSVNHKYLDLTIKLPQSLNAIEDRIRRKISSVISRGKVDVFIVQRTSEKQGIKVSLNENLCDSYVKVLKDMKNRYNISEPISLSLISKFPNVIETETVEEDMELVWDVLSKAIDSALDMLLNMRKKEGIKLQDNILKRCSNLSRLVSKVKERAPNLVPEYREKLNQRLKEILSEDVIDKNRVALEVALFADKSNIDEEIERLESHIIQFTDTAGLDEPVGRKLDFLVQEMNRESNTIASKANDIELVNFVLQIKNEIEKIREQIQNIE